MTPGSDPAAGRQHGAVPIASYIEEAAARFPFSRGQPDEIVTRGLLPRSQMAWRDVIVFAAGVTRAALSSDGAIKLSYGELTQLGDTLVTVPPYVLLQSRASSSAAPDSVIGAVASELLTAPRGSPAGSTTKSAFDDAVRFMAEQKVPLVLQHGVPAPDLREIPDVEARGGMTSSVTGCWRINVRKSAVNAPPLALVTRYAPRSAPGGEQGGHDTQFHLKVPFIELTGYLVHELTNVLGALSWAQDGLRALPVDAGWYHHRFADGLVSRTDFALPAVTVAEENRFRYLETRRYRRVSTVDFVDLKEMPFHAHHLFKELYSAFEYRSALSLSQFPRAPFVESAFRGEISVPLPTAQIFPPGMFAPHTSPSAYGAELAAMHDLGAELFRELEPLDAAKTFMDMLVTAHLSGDREPVLSLMVGRCGYSATSFMRLISHVLPSLHGQHGRIGSVFVRAWVDAGRLEPSRREQLRPRIMSAYNEWMDDLRSRSPESSEPGGRF